jgi:hypothetical protein
MELLMKYTGWCQNDFDVQGYTSTPSRTSATSDVVAPASTMPPRQEAWW